MQLSKQLDIRLHSDLEKNAISATQVRDAALEIFSSVRKDADIKGVSKEQARKEIDNRLSIQGILEWKSLVWGVRDAIRRECSYYRPCSKEPFCLECKSGEDKYLYKKECRYCRFLDSDITSIKVRDNDINRGNLVSILPVLGAISK